MSSKERPCASGATLAPLSGAAHYHPSGGPSRSTPNCTWSDAQEIESLRASAAAASAAAKESEEGLKQQLAQAHAAGAEMEALLEAERQAGEVARTEATEREAQVAVVGAGPFSPYSQPARPCPTLLPT